LPHPSLLICKSNKKDKIGIIAGANIMKIGYYEACYENFLEIDEFRKTQFK